MLDKIQFLLSLQILGFCFFGGLTLLLKARDNRAKQILGWSMLLWAFLAAVRVSVNLYVNDSKEVFHPDVLVTGCLVSASLACYVIEVLRPRYLTLKRFLLFISPLLISGLSFFIYRLAGGEIHVYYSLKDVFVNFDLDMFLRLVLLLFTLIYMTLPVYLVLKYSKEFTKYLSEKALILNYFYEYHSYLIIISSTIIFKSFKVVKSKLHKRDLLSTLQKILSDK